MNDLILHLTLYASLVRDIGIIIGIPTLIVVAQRLHSKQIAALKAQLEFAKDTQYDKALALIEAQKKVFTIERELLEKELLDFQKRGEQYKEETVRLQAKIRELNVGVDQLTKITYNLEESLTDISEGITVYQRLLIGKVDGIIFKTRLSDAEIVKITDTHSLANPDQLLRVLRDFRKGHG